MHSRACGSGGSWPAPAVQAGAAGRRTLPGVHISHRPCRSQACSAVAQGGGRVKGWWQMMALTFTTTLREGIESVVFLTGVSAGVDPRSIPLAGLVGIVLGVAVGVALFYTCAPSAPCSLRTDAPHAQANRSRSF